MSLRPSRRGLVPPFIAMDVLRAANERQAAGAEIIHLEVGQPGSSAPEPVLEAARRALVSEPIGYTDALGIAPLRQAIATHYQAQYGVAVDPEEVVVTTGSSAAFLLAFLAAFEPGDRVGLAIPGYPAYRNILSALEIEPVLIAVGENAHYQPTPELLADVGRLDGLIVASPANPTGTMISAADLARLTTYCRDQGIRLVSDEIYHGITYETAAATARAYGREAIVVNSFSKYYSMTGWRLGWMLVPPDLARSVECLAQNFYISPPALSQIAALPVFGCRAELDGHVGRYRDQPRSVDRRPRRRRADPLRTGRRSVLPLRRYFEPDTGQRGILPAAPRRDWGRRDPRSRFRSGQWRRLGALLLCRIDRKRRRGGAPSKGLAAERSAKTIDPVGR